MEGSEDFYIACDNEGYVIRRGSSVYLYVQGMESVWRKELKELAEKRRMKIKLVKYTDIGTVEEFGTETKEQARKRIKKELDWWKRKKHV